MTGQIKPITVPWGTREQYKHSLRTEQSCRRVSNDLKNDLRMNQESPGLYPWGVSKAKSFFLYIFMHGDVSTKNVCFGIMTK